LDFDGVDFSADIANADVVFVFEGLPVAGVVVPQGGARNV